MKKQETEINNQVAINRISEDAKNVEKYSNLELNMSQLKQQAKSQRELLLDFQDENTRMLSILRNKDNEIEKLADQLSTSFIIQKNSLETSAISEKEYNLPGSPFVKSGNSSTINLSANRNYLGVSKFGDINLNGFSDRSYNHSYDKVNLSDEIKDDSDVLTETLIVPGLKLDVLENN